MSFRMLMVAAAVLVLVSGCSTSATAEAFWPQVRIVGDEVEGYNEISAMASAADAVVVGHFVNKPTTRVFQGDAPEDVVTYLVTDLRVDRVLAGKLDGNSVRLELLWNSTPREMEIPNLPTDQMVVFLRAKRGNGEAGKFRAVNSYGLWAPTTRGALDTPLAESATESPFADEVGSMDSVSDLADYVDSKN